MLPKEICELISFIDKYDFLERPVYIKLRRNIIQNHIPLSGFASVSNLSQCPHCIDGYANSVEKVVCEHCTGGYTIKAKKILRRYSAHGYNFYLPIYSYENEKITVTSEDVIRPLLKPQRNKFTDQYEPLFLAILKLALVSNELAIYYDFCQTPHGKLVLGMFSNELEQFRDKYILTKTDVA